MNNFLMRTLSGAFFVSLVIASILIHEYLFVTVFAIFAAWAVSEFHRLTNHQPDVDVNQWLGVVGAVLLFVCSFLFASGAQLYPIFSVYGFYVALVLVFGLYQKCPNPIHNWAYFLLGQIFVALPFSLLSFILYIDGFQPIILLALFLTIWVNDTGAYLFGISFGKRRLFERISPKKSWEGFFGGAFAASVSGYIFSIFIPQLTLVEWIVFSEIIVVFGTYGDLIESLLKRTVNVKDSGTAIPGHGGLLDRFDSMLLAAPLIYIYLSFVL